MARYFFLDCRGVPNDSDRLGSIVGSSWSGFWSWTVEAVVVIEWSSVASTVACDCSSVLWSAVVFERWASMRARPPRPPRPPRPDREWRSRVGCFENSDG
jgi:hypothetical protein